MIKLRIERKPCVKREMGKSTFKRVVRTLHQHYVAVGLPVLGGVLFVVGSFCFSPGASEGAIGIGATTFLIGSVCYWVHAPPPPPHA